MLYYNAFHSTVSTFYFRRGSAPCPANPLHYSLIIIFFSDQQIRLYYRLKAVCFPCKFTWHLYLHNVHIQTIIELQQPNRPGSSSFQRKKRNRKKRSRKRIIIIKKTTHKKESRSRSSNSNKNIKKKTTNEAHKAIRLFLVFLRFFVSVINTFAYKTCSNIKSAHI